MSGFTMVDFRRLKAAEEREVWRRIAQQADRLFFQMLMNPQENPMSTDQAIEQEIQAKGLTAPRITPADIEANIASEHYFTAREGVLGMLASDGVPATAYEQANAAPQELALLTFCVLVLQNGFTVTGWSKPVVAENFDAEIGRKLARAKAIEEIWPLMGYALKNELARPVLTDADALADLMGTPRPDHPRA